MKSTPNLKLDRRLLVIAGTVLALVALVLAGLTLVGGNDGDADAASDEVTAAALAAQLAQGLETQLAPLRQAVESNPAVAEALAAGRPAGAELRAQLAASHPEILSVRLLPLGHREVDYQANPPLTYAALDMLAKAEESGTAPPPEALLMGTEEAHVAMLVPVTGAGGETLGHVFFALAGGLVQAEVDRLPAVTGQVRVTQHVPGGPPVQLASRGTSDGATATGRPLPGFPWKLVYHSGAAPAAGDGLAGLVPLPWLAGGAALVVLAALLLVWRRRQASAAAEPLEEAPVLMEGAVREVGVMSHDTVEFVVEDYMARSGHDAGAPGITVSEEPPMEEPAAEPDSDFMDIFGEVEAEPEAAPSPDVPPAAEPAAGPPAAIFRAYDIRGPVAAGGLDADLARQVGQAVGSAAVAAGENAFVVGRDGRSSSPELAEALIGGLVDAGMDVIDLGLAPTPVVYFAAHYLDVGSCVAVTGSHNPPADNGFKVMIGGRSLTPEGIQDLRRRIVEGEMVSGEGQVQQMDVGADYIRRISEDIPVALGNAFKLVVDCANGATSELAPRLYRALGHDVVDLFCKVDGAFPNHPPDPTDPANLAALQAAVKEHEADLGLALDGDGDRLVVVDGGGHILWPDRLLMAFAGDVLSRNPGAAIVYDVKCSRHLPRVIEQAGGRPVMWKSGHSLMKAKVAETGAPVGGEMSGHFFFKERWYGFDDGLYAGARLLEILQGQGDAPAAFLQALPQGLATPELRIALAEGEQHAVMERLDGAVFEGAEVDRTDGLRAEYADGWGLVRASNTTPALVLRFEADDEAALKRIQGQFREVVAKARPGLRLPF